jgi:hypothetical protein
LVLVSLGGFVTNHIADYGAPFPFLAPLGTSAVYGALGGAAAVGYLACHVSSIGAIVTGWMALRRATRYPAKQARKGWAVAGLVLGVVILVLFLCTDALGAVVGIVCSNSSGGCF